MFSITIYVSFSPKVSKLSGCVLDKGNKDIIHKNQMFLFPFTHKFQRDYTSLINHLNLKQSLCINLTTQNKALISLPCQSNILHTEVILYDVWQFSSCFTKLGNNSTFLCNSKTEPKYKVKSILSAYCIIFKHQLQHLLF